LERDKAVICRVLGRQIESPGLTRIWLAKDKIGASGIVFRKYAKNVDTFIGSVERAAEGDKGELMGGVVEGALVVGVLTSEPEEGEQENESA
jgi:hypothetical protein